MGAKIGAAGASGGGALPVPADAFVREDGVITAPPSSGGVQAVAAADASVTVGGTGENPALATGTLTQIAALHPGGSGSLSSYSPLLYGGVWGWPWEFWIDAYGAAAATFVPDAAAAASSATLTSASGGFAGASAGDPVLVAAAGASIGSTPGTLVTTIQTAGSATSVTLAAAASHTTTSPNGAVWGPGCGAAVKSALAAATTYMGSSSGRRAKIITPPGWFMLETAAVTGAPAHANAQVPLPLGGLNAPYYPEFHGVAGATPVSYFGSSLPPQGGSAWVCARTDGTPNGTSGYSSMLGGPTPPQGYGPDAPGSPLFSNVKPVIDGLGFIVPANSSYCGVDFTCCAKAAVPAASVLVLASESQLNYPNYQANLSNFTWGLAMPYADNNDDATIGDISAAGLAWALVPSEHTAVTSARLLYAYNALTPTPGTSGDMPHSMRFGYVSAEACINAINMGNATGKVVMNIAMLDTENIDNLHVNDAGNDAYGIVNVSSFGQALLKDGAANLTINFTET